MRYVTLEHGKNDSLDQNFEISLSLMINLLYLKREAEVNMEFTVMFKESRTPNAQTPPSSPKIYLISKLIRIKI